MDPNIEKLLELRRKIDAKLAELMRIPTDSNAEPSTVFPSGPVFPQRSPERESGMGGVDRHPPLPKPSGLLV